MRLNPVALVLSLTIVSAASAAITVDGTRDALYGGALAVQAVNTQFGDASPPGSLGGSELDAGYAKIWNGRLYVMLTGNHEPNFNKLDVFIDSVAGAGENVLTGTPQYDFFSGSAWISQNMVGLGFDPGFTADYHLFSRWGSGSGPYEVDFVNRAGGGSAMVPGSSQASAAAVGLIAVGSIPAGDVGPNASGTALTQPLDFAINNNNGGGVTGSLGDPVGMPSPPGTPPASVATGMEFSIALADLGNPAVGSTIKIAAMINNGDHNYLSNQVLGPLPAGTGNLGGNGSGGFIGNLSGVNFSQYPGLQYFEVHVVNEIPEPSTMLLSGLYLIGAVLGVRRRR